MERKSARKAILLILSIVALLGNAMPTMAADGDPLTSNYGTAGAGVDTDRELGGTVLPYATAQTTATANCSSGSISGTTITVDSTANFDATGGVASIQGGGKINIFTYTGITATTFTGVANASNGELPTCADIYASGARIYSVTSVATLASRIAVLMDAIQNAQTYAGLVGTVAQLPAAGTLGRLFVVTDATGDTDCGTGGGTTKNLCLDNGSSWIDTGGTGTTPTLQQVFAQGKTITTANSEANAMQVGDGTYGWKFWGDPTNGPQQKAFPASDYRIDIPTNYQMCVRDVEAANANVECTDPDAASVNAMYQYGANYRPLKSVYWSAGATSTDGTQCGAPTERTINSGPKLFTVICTDNDASRIEGQATMPDSWDGGTVTFELHYLQTAADTAVMNSDVSCACRGAGETVNNTFGTEVAIDDAAVSGSNIIDHTTSAAATCNGTCAAGDTLFWRWELDAIGTTTAVATLHMIGMKMEYSTSSRSD